MKERLLTRGFARGILHCPNYHCTSGDVGHSQRRGGDLALYPECAAWAAHVGGVGEEVDEWHQAIIGTVK